MTTLSPTLPRQLVFATNFSEACHAAIPLVAQWVDTLQARLTLLHVHPRGAQAQARRSLDSFFAEAAHYPGCERVLLTGDPVRAIADWCRESPQSLLVMPPSSRTHLPRLLHNSLRGRVLRESATPMLTLPYANASAGSVPVPASAGGHVACWITGQEQRLDHVREAAMLARRRGAELHLMYALPEIDEGLLMEALAAPRPLAEPSAMRWLEDIAGQLGDDLAVRLQIATGDTRPVLRRLLRRSRASVLVVDRDTMTRKRLLQASFNHANDEPPYLLICVPPRLHEGADPMLPPPSVTARRLWAKPRTTRARKALAAPTKPREDTTVQLRTLELAFA